MDNSPRVWPDAFHVYLERAMSHGEIVPGVNSAAVSAKMDEIISHAEGMEKQYFDAIAWERMVLPHEMVLQDRALENRVRIGIGQEYASSVSFRLHAAAMYQSPLSVNPGQEQPQQAPPESRRKPWICAFCDKSYIHKSSLTKHLQNKHSQSIPHHSSGVTEWTPQADEGTLDHENAPRPQTPARPPSLIPTPEHTYPPAIPTVTMERLHNAMVQGQPAEFQLLPVENNVAFTDSGYASGPCAERRASNKPIEDENHHHDNSYVTCHGGVDSSDAQTEYSVATAINQNWSQSYLSKICDDIYAKIRDHVNVKDWPTTSALLPGFIKAFSFKVGLEQSSQMNLDAMYFLHHHHKYVMTALMVIYLAGH